MLNTIRYATRFALGPIALVTAALLAGCGGTSADMAGQAGQGADARPDEGEAAAPGRAQGSGDADPASVPRIVPEDRAIIYTATLRVRTRAVEPAASRAKQLVSSAGGYVHDERTTADPRREAGTTATVTFKIPADQYQDVLAELGSRLGTRLHLEQQAQDVTGEVADVEARLQSARASLDRLRQLLAEAEEVGEVLSVESEIADREAELESLQARQRALASQTQFATVTLELVGPEADDQRDTGFLAGLGAGWRAFVASVGWLATAVGAMLPFVAAFGIVGYGTWRTTRAVRRRRRTASAPAASPPPPAS